MAKSIRDNKKAKRGRPRTTGTGVLVGVRLHEPILGTLDRWISEEKPRPTRPEAIRRLVERALAAEPSAPGRRSKGAQRANEMAGRQIDQMGDQSATDDERAGRKRSLIHGPKELRGMRRK